MISSAIISALIVHSLPFPLLNVFQKIIKIELKSSQNH